MNGERERTERERARNRTYRVEGGAEGDYGGGGGEREEVEENGTREIGSTVSCSAQLGSAQPHIVISPCFRGERFFKFVAEDLPDDPLGSSAGRATIGTAKFRPWIECKTRADKKREKERKRVRE